MQQLEMRFCRGADSLRAAIVHLLTNGLECEHWTRKMHSDHGRYLLEWFGDVALSEITYPKIAEYYRAEQKRGLARETLRKRLSTLRMVLCEAVRMDWIEKLPAWPVIKTDSRPKNDYWTVTEWEAAHLACDEDDLRTLFAVMFWTGSHTSDAYRLRWQDIDLVKNTWIRRNTKSKAEPVPLPLPSRLREILEERRQQIMPHSRDLVVGRNMGHPNRKIKELAERADVPRIRPIGLRHSCITHLKDQGCDDDFRSFWIGHKPGSVVAKKTYMHVTDRQIADGMTRIESKISTA